MTLERTEFQRETIRSVILCFAEQNVFELLLVSEKVGLFFKETIFFHC